MLRGRPRPTKGRGAKGNCIACLRSNSNDDATPRAASLSSHHHHHHRREDKPTLSRLSFFLSFFFLPFFVHLFGDVAFSEYFLYHFAAFSLHGRYVVRSFLPNGVFLPCDHGLVFFISACVRIQSIQSINVQ